MQRQRTLKNSVNAGQTGMESFLQPKGFVADMIDQINSTPPSSPAVAGAELQGKRKMLSIKNGQLSVEDDDMDQCFQGESDHAETDSQPDHDNVETNEEKDIDDDEATIDLPSILKELNAAVKKLEKGVRKLGVDNKEVETKMSRIEVVQSQESVRVRGIVESLDDQQDKIDMLIGIVARQDVQIKALQNRWDTAYAKDSRSNIIINGLTEIQGENCHHEVGNFIKNVLKVEKVIAVQHAFCIGKGQNKAMVAKLKNTEDRAEVFKKVGNLKEVNKG